MSNYLNTRRGDFSRLKLAATKVAGRALLLCVMLLIASSVMAFDPPMIISVLTGPQEHQRGFADDFCWVGDQNGDGYDDLLVNHGTWLPRHGDQEFSNRIELYYGGNPMDSIPDFIIAGNSRGPIQVGERINFLGHLTENGNTYIAVQAQEETDIWRRAYDQVRIYEAGSEFDDQPEFVLNSDVGNSYLPGVTIGLGRRISPTDVNGDGFHDLICARFYFAQEDSLDTRLEIYYGGVEFDTIPDWQSSLNTSSSGGFEYTSGFDLNADGFNDIITRHNDNHYKYLNKYSLYLGGDPIDTVAVWEFYEDRSADTFMNKGFAMVPDVNGDGFDDWIIHYWVDDEHNDPTFRQGYFLFYGSRNPDSEPDILLDGHPSCWGTDGEVTGGDVNGDGYGDIVTSGRGGFQLDGSLNIHFGSRWINKNPDISINGYNEYGDLVENGFGWQLDGVGDYNDDGVDDIIVTGGIMDGPYGAIPLGGRRDWHVSVTQESSLVQNYELTLDVLPNPFNSRVNITLTVPTRGDYRVEVFDVTGRLIGELTDRWGRLSYGEGEQTFTWQAPGAGIYFVVLSSSDGRRVVRKAVCLP